jgi:hypothetical protein
MSKNTRIQWRIMLLDMKPFGPGHYAALQAVKSGFLAETKATYTDLMKAALICSRPSDCIGKFGDGFLFKIWLRVWLRRCRKLDWNAESARLQLFIYDGLKLLRDSIIAEQAKAGGE